MTWLIQTDIEGSILRLGDLLEAATDALAAASEAAANAEVDYRAQYAEVYLNNDGPEHLRSQMATRQCRDLMRQRFLTAARRDSLQEKCRQLRAQLDAVRTVSANVRSAGG